MTETEIRKLRETVLQLWEGSEYLLLVREDLFEYVQNLKKELAEKIFDGSAKPHSFETIKQNAWIAFIEAYDKKDLNNGTTAESEEAAHNALDKYLEKLKNVVFKEDTHGEKTEKIERGAGLAELEKINWRGTETQLVLLVDLLIHEALLKSDRKWKMIEEHFLVQGKPTKSKNLSQSLENTLAGKTKDEETLKKIVSEVKKLED
jgi:hypothetical protein